MTSFSVLEETYPDLPWVITAASALYDVQTEVCLVRVSLTRSPATEHDEDLVTPWWCFKVTELPDGKEIKEEEDLLSARFQSPVEEPLKVIQYALHATMGIHPADHHVQTVYQTFLPPDPSPVENPASTF
jgi:hypothetical protein